MIEKSITPNTNKLIIDIPNEYIGKKTHLQIDLIEKKNKKPSDFLGTIDDETASKFHKHLKKIKNNWE